jgi:hypothetical protein
MRDDHMVDHNPYFEYFRDSVGKGDNQYNTYKSGIGDFVSLSPDFRRGYGISSRDTMYNPRVQLGAGIGSFFGSLFNFAKPLLRRGAKELLNLGSNVANDVLSGENFKDTLKKHVKGKINEKLPPPIAAEVNKRMGLGKRKISRGKSSHKQGAKKKRKTLVDYPALKFIP